jgi:hypothetical protein
VLVAVAAIGSESLLGRDLTAYRITSALNAGTVMLVLALIVVLVAIVFSHKEKPAAPSS